MRFAPLLLGLSLGLGLALGGCQSSGPKPATPTPISEVNPDQTQAQKALCEARGGEFKPGGIHGFLTCYQTPKDAGKSCSAASDCGTGNCLARSKTCAPITPLFGCNDLLDHNGRLVTLCVD